MRRRRRRRRLNKRFLVLVATLAALLVLLICVAASCGKEDPPAPDTPPGNSTPANTSEPTSDPASDDPTESTTEPEPQLGWQEMDGERYYLLSDGSRATGWQEIGGKRFYFDSKGVLQTGWLEVDGTQYYFREDGSMATGKVEIEGENHYFTSAGAPILLVNPWNYVPDDYEPDLVELGLSISVEGSKVDRSCYDALLSMINDCNKECPSVCVASSYRTHEYQTTAYNRKVKYYLGLGYSQEKAEKEAGTIIAVPGTSEHQLGLAVDIIDTRLWALEEEQEDLPAQKWLMEHCWEYGFILRYPKNKMDSTGIIYEPWHYRYVGKEVAQEIHESGLTLEEYLENLTT